jgi:competence protein ComEA
MAVEKALSANKWIVTGMLITGGALLVYAFIHSSNETSIPGWKPVNGPLKAALDNVQIKDEPELMKSSTIPSDYFSSQKGAVNKGNTSEAHKDETKKARTTTQEAAKATTETDSSALLDLNHASQSELEKLPGIGPSKAKAIITFRDQHKGFRNLEQLLEVKGIGPKVLERLSKLIRISAAE